MKERVVLRIMCAVSLFFIVLICGLEVYQRRFLPLPKSVVTINSSIVELPPSFEKVLEGEELVVSLNTATAVELEMIPGIGEVLAKNILDYREAHGNFTRVEDVMQVKGIGEKTFEKIKKHLTL